jgi:hypothetical protein
MAWCFSLRAASMVWINTSLSHGFSRYAKASRLPEMAAELTLAWPVSMITCD